jgi:ATP-dependent DNA helicase UvrD/PcrA
VKGNGPKPALITCEREEDQTDFVVEKVLEHNESGFGLRRQAILVRTAYWSDHLEVELTRRNIPYRKYGGLKFLESAHIKDLMSFLRVLENPRDQLAWTRILRLLEGVGPAFAKRAYEAVAESGGDVAALKWVPASAPVEAELTKLANLIRSLSRKNSRENVRISNGSGPFTIHSSSGFTRMRMLVSAIWSSSSKSPPPRPAGRLF